MCSDVNVSVVVAAYNVAHCVRESIRSLQLQAQSPFEILICEDCSTDNTRQILQELAREDPRIRLICNEQNSGQAVGRNKCFALARGEYIAIHDADDYSEPDRLLKEAAFLKNNPEYAFVASLVSTIDDLGSITERPYIVQGEVEKNDFLWGQPFIHPTTMFRKSALTLIGGYLVNKETRYRNEDYDLFMRLYAVGCKGYVLSERLYVYFEGQAAFKRRKYRYRLAEAKVRFRNFKRLGLMPRGLIYTFKPLIVGLFPQAALHGLRRMFYTETIKRGSYGRLFH